jgi:serine/threonine protein kinase
MECFRQFVAPDDPQPIFEFMPRIGRYEIQGEIGRGAMGVVYLAHDPRLRRRVAVKTYLLPDGISDELVREFHERFLREAQAAASLSHPGIVTIFDAGEDHAQNLPFIAMEYIQGRSLKQLLEQGDRLEPGWVFTFGTVLADALHVAHRAGIIHRDIKPANILLRGPDGAAKIADFGVARLPTSELTQTGASLGSPAYMSPEQIHGSPLDGRSDLFSLAAVLYEALCGKRPFSGDDLPSLVYSIAHETPVPISRRVRQLPSGLDAFFDRALAKDPAQRFPDGEAFGRAFVESSRQPAAPRLDETVVQEEREETPRPDATDLAADSDEREPSEPPSTARSRPGRFLGLKFSMAALLSITLMGATYFWLGRSAHLKLDARSSIESGTLSLEVDGHEVYSRHLASPARTKGVFTRLLGRDQETFEGWIKIAPGKHEVAAHVVPEGDESPLQDSIVVDLRAGETRTLRMVAGRSFGTPLSLKVD